MATSKISVKSAEKKTGAKCCKSVKTTKCAKPTTAKGDDVRRLEVKLPPKVVKQLTGLAKDLGVDFAGACSYNITINLMRTGNLTRAEYAKGIKDLVKRYGIAADKFPAYIKGGDPKEVKRFDAFCAKNRTVAKANSKDVGKVMAGAAKAVARGKMTVADEKPVKKAKAKKPGTAAKRN